MSVPNWWSSVLLIGAAWRMFQLLAQDDVLNRPRHYVTERLSSYWQDFLVCPYCAGFWIALLWWLAWLIWPHGTLVAATPFALSSGVIGAYKLLASEE